ncbi:MAG: flagellar hook capping protein [Clostridiales bacterium]|jgi:flagellar basal-body rod modification protein FlgD|nr:flagellar hook capping protein [Clostridiales bacterium]
MPISGVSGLNGVVYPDGINPKLGSSDLGINDFLTLLTAQLRNQNVMEPASDTEFIAQMAQFSSLQAIKELSVMFQNTQAVAFIGKNVIVRNVYDSENETYISGWVQSVNFEEGIPYLLIGDKYYKMSDVTDVYIGTPTAEDDTDVPYNGEGNIAEV